MDGNCFLYPSVKAHCKDCKDSKCPVVNGKCQSYEMLDVYQEPNDCTSCCSFCSNYGCSERTN